MGKGGKGKGGKDRLLKEVGKREKGLVFSLSPIKMHPFDHKSAKRIECKRSDVFETFTLSPFPFTLSPFPFPPFPTSLRSPSSTALPRHEKIR